MIICCEGSSSKTHKHTQYPVYVLATQDPNTLECSKKGEKKVQDHMFEESLRRSNLNPGEVLYFLEVKFLYKKLIFILFYLLKFNI